jgi:hypothetical protein
VEDGSLETAAAAAGDRAEEVDSEAGAQAGTRAKRAKLSKRRRGKILEAAKSKSAPEDELTDARPFFASASSEAACSVRCETHTNGTTRTTATRCTTAV